MKPCFRGHLLFLIFSCVLGSKINLGNPSWEGSPKELKLKVFRLKTDVNAFGKPQESRWSSRRIYYGKISLPEKDFPSRTESGKAPIPLNQRKDVLINGKKTWCGMYFVSKEAFVVERVSLRRDSAVLQLDSLNKKTKRTLHLLFEGLDRLDIEFCAIFFNEGEDTGGYEREVNKLLIEKYIDAKPELAQLKTVEKEELLTELRSLSTRGYPEIEIHNGKAFACLRLERTPPDDRFYADRDRRVTTSAGVALQGAIAIIDAARLRSPHLQGFVFLWDSSYVEPFEERDEIEERLRLRTTRSIFESFEKGELSITEIIENSFLRVDGRRYYLSSHERENEGGFQERDGHRRPVARA